MTIEVMYGEIPIENRQVLHRTTTYQVYMLKNGKEERFCNEAAFTPGTVICAPRRNTNNTNTVNSILPSNVFYFKSIF